MRNPIGLCIDRNPFPCLEGLIAAVAAAGFDQIEWFETGAEQPWSAPETAERIRALVRRREIVSRYHAPYEAPMDLASADGRLRSAAEGSAVLVQCLDRAERLGARLVTLHLGTCPPGEGRARALDRVIESIRLTLPELERRRVRLALENHTKAIIQGSMGDHPEDFDLLMSVLPAEWVGRTLDVGHAHINGHLDEFLSRPFDRVWNIHLHDNNGREDEHLPIGEGAIPWDEVLGRIAAEAYAGPLTLEFTAPPQAYLASLARLRSA
jgi:sugar phosphate isomerase/epimerase